MGTPRLSWRRLRAVVRWSPSTSALVRSMHGEAADWSTETHLLASAVDALRAANWQRGGGKGKKPKPIERPGQEDNTSTKTYGGSRTVPLDEAKAFFDRLNRAPEGAEPGADDGTVSCAGDGCVRTDIHARGMCGKHYQRWRRGLTQES